MKMLEIENLTFSFSKKNPPVVNDFSFTVHEGEIVGAKAKCIANGRTI